MNKITVPKQLTQSCSNTPEGIAWLQQLPAAIIELCQRWSLTIDQPFAAEASCSWVAPCIRADGTNAVLKVGLPHMEAENEIDGLRFWAGDPTAYLFEADVDCNAMLIEQCLPGTILRTRPEDEQDRVIAKLMRRLWRVPPNPHPFRPLAEMTAAWAQEARENAEAWPDAGLAQEGLRLFAELPTSAMEHVLLATDLHAGNVLQAQREPWLVIDPKPFVGDPAYDATQHLLNCNERLHAAPIETIQRFADLLGVDGTRVQLWIFARLAITATNESPDALTLARRLAPQS